MPVSTPNMLTPTKNKHSDRVSPSTKDDVDRKNLGASLFLSILLSLMSTMLPQDTACPTSGRLTAELGRSPASGCLGRPGQRVEPEVP
jgi:hypothetical protein